MFGNLVLPSVPGRFGGEATILKPAGKRPGVVVDNFVLLHLGIRDKSFTTNITEMFLLFLACMERQYMKFKVPVSNKSLSTFPALDSLQTTPPLVDLQSQLVFSNFPACLTAPGVFIMSGFSVSCDLVRVDVVVATDVANVSFSDCCFIFALKMSHFDPIIFTAKLKIFLC